MTRTEQLFLCKKCTHRKMDMQQGLLCALTGKKADFMDTCLNYSLDETVKAESLRRAKAVRPNRQRAQITEMLIWSVLVLDVLCIWSSYLQYDLLIQLQAGIWIPDRVLDDNDTREQVLGIAYMIVHISSAIAFLLWFRRGYYNLRARTGSAHSEGWATGSWFVPIIALYRPYQIMKEMWDKTTKMITDKKPDYHSKFDTSIIGFWWAFWIFCGFMGRYVLRSAFNMATVDEFINATIASIGESVFGLPLALLTIWMIKTYASKEELLTKLERSPF